MYIFSIVLLCNIDSNTITAPGTRVMFLLKEKSELPALFTEMGELGGNEWRETARWVKFEEDVEQGQACSFIN